MPSRDSAQPDFIIGGAPRSGTTFLAHALDHHPRIEMAKPFIPEPKVFLTEAEEGPEGYLHRYSAYFGAAEHGRLYGEKTSNYLENEEALRRMRETFQHMRFVFIVREPVSRAYSNYLWSRHNGLETLSFAEAVVREGSRENPLGPEKAYARPFDYLTRGNYATFAERYFNAFGRENVGFFLFEDLIDRPVTLLAAVQRFVGVEPVDLSQAEMVTSNTTSPEDAPIEAALELRLRERMRPLALAFAKVASVDITPWGY
jgi:hypothetical protein